MDTSSDTSSDTFNEVRRIRKLTRGKPIKISGSVRAKFKEKGLALKGEEKRKAILKKRIGPKKKIYVDARCAYVSPEGKRCTRKAIGSGQTCRDHGGVVDLENTLSPEATRLYLAIQGEQTPFLPNLHPLQYIDLSRQGCSPVEIAAEIGVGEGTLKKWADRYSEMALAVDIGKAMHESWWLSQGKTGLNKRGFNTNLYKYLTSNKIGYSDKMETKSTNMHIHGVLVVPGSQSVDEWEESRRDPNDAKSANPSNSYSDDVNDVNDVVDI
jgi:hypothetical protein